MTDMPSNRLERDLREKIMGVIREMSACRVEMEAGIDYEYNQDLLDELRLRRDALKLLLDTTTSFRKFAENR